MLWEAVYRGKEPFFPALAYVAFPPQTTLLPGPATLNLLLRERPAAASQHICFEPTDQKKREEKKKKKKSKTKLYVYVGMHVNSGCWGKNDTHKEHIHGHI